MLDSIDREILVLLQKNARMSNAEIARKVNLAQSAVLNRIRRMEKEKVILGYEARVDPRALDLGMDSFVKVDTNERPDMLEIGEKIAKLPEVREVHFMAADFQYLIRVRERDPAAHAEFVRKLGKLGVQGCRTLLVLKTLKESLALNIPEEK